jgi:hypothetical protein
MGSYMKVRAFLNSSLNLISINVVLIVWVVIKHIIDDYEGFFEVAKTFLTHKLSLRASELHLPRYSTSLAEHCYSI